MDAVPKQASPPQKLAVDKFTDQGVACFRLSGRIDEDFEGKKLAQTIHARTLVLHLADIKRISSFGIREWVDFITVANRVTEELILVECAPKVVDQLNMVGNFVGSGRVFSFYAPYRCDYCDTEDRVLMQVDRDWEVIKAMKPPERPCPSCGDTEYFDEDPVTYFSFIAAQGRFELDPGVTALLASKLNHAGSDAAQRLRVDKIIEERFTHLKMSGDLDVSFPRVKLAEGLEGTIIIDLTSLGRVDPPGAAEWRSFIQILTPAAEAIYLLGVPPAFLEKLTSRDDLGPRAQVVTINLPYACSSCATTAPHSIDVFQHYDVLKFATPPEMRCDDCKAPAHCSAPESLLSHLPSLPKPSVSAPVRKFIKSISERKPIGRRPSVITPIAETPVVVNERRGSWAMVMTAALFAAILTAGGLIGYHYLQQSDADPAASRLVGERLEASAPARPEWITFDTPFSASCETDADLGMTCLGISSYAANEADARAEAQNAALEAMAHALGPRIDHPNWSRNVAGIFSDMRQAKLSLLSEQSDHSSMQYDRAVRNARNGRAAVAAGLRKTAGSDFPTTPTSQYWERYEGPRSVGFRYLVFVQYTLSGSRVDELIETYATPARAGSVEVMTAFPGIAWRYPDVDSGAVITAIGDGVLQSMGLTAQYVVLSIQDRVIKDAPSFARILTEELEQLRARGGNLRLVVKTSDNAPIEFNQPIASARAGDSGSKPARRSEPPRLPGPVNTWDRVGGGNGRDNPAD